MVFNGGMKSLRLISFLSISIYMCSQMAFGQAVLIEENGQPTKTKFTKEATNTLNFRSQRKVGVGLAAAGAQGLLGTLIELNFSSETSFMTNFGLGKDYRSFGFSLKRIVGGEWFAPYILGGFSRWYSVGDHGSINTSTPSFLADNFLSAKQKRTGHFTETILYPGIGLQYHQLNGEYAGASLFAEVLFLVDIDDFATAPTGSLGFMYYF